MQILHRKPERKVAVVGLTTIAALACLTAAGATDTAAPKLDVTEQGRVLAEQRLRWLAAASGIEKMEETPELLALGRKTYEQRCVSCHGLTGRGNGPAAPYLRTKPRDFPRNEFKLRTTLYFPTDEDLFRTITVGFPAYGMPEFDYLSVEQRWALVAYVKQLGREGLRQDFERDFVESELGVDIDAITPEIAEKNAKKLEAIRKDAAEVSAEKFSAAPVASWGEPVPFSPEAVARGRQVYIEWGCGSCHGPEGHADGPSSADLKDNQGRKIDARDFALNRWYFKAGDTPADIARTLATGMKGTPMPSHLFGDETLPDLWKLAHYINSLVGTGGEMATGEE